MYIAAGDKVNPPRHRLGGSLIGPCLLLATIKELTMSTTKKKLDPARFPRYPDYSVFHAPEDFQNVPPISDAIKGFVQNDAATLFVGLSGHGKTLVLLSIVKALLSGRKLWGQFKVREKAMRVVYLTPESALIPFNHRLKLFGLDRYTQDGRLLVHTLSKGLAPRLDDHRILDAVNGAHVFLDTAIRFGEGEENSASDNQAGLGKQVFIILGAGAETVIAAHHSPKQFAKEHTMTLENMSRGSGDIGATFATAWGIRQLDPERNILHIQNLKPRDLKPCGPFQIVGRPYIDTERDFRMHKKPGECGVLAEEMRSHVGTAGKRSQQKAKAIVRTGKLIEELGEDITDKEIIKEFRKRGWNKELGESTARLYRKLAIEAKPGAKRLGKANR